MLNEQSQVGLFEELAMPLFAVYNFAHWQTQNRDEAEEPCARDLYESA